MTTAKFPELMAQVRAGVSKGAGVFGVGYSTLDAPAAPFVLAVGGIKASTTHGQIRDSRGGYIVTLGMTFDQIEQLRDSCIELLAEHHEAVKKACGGQLPVMVKPDVQEDEPA